MAGISDARREYEPYVSGVYSLLAAGASARKLAEHFFAIEKRPLGMKDSNSKSLIPLAERWLRLNVESTAKGGSAQRLGRLEQHAWSLASGFLAASGSSKSRDNLHTYLHDHLAGARSALEVLAHLRDSAGDGPLRAIAAELHAEVAGDRDLLTSLAQEIGGGSNPLKEAGAWLAENVARLKLGSMGGAPAGLPALEAVEFLCLGILGKVALWDALAAASAVEPSLRLRPYAVLRGSAQQQHDRLEVHRVRLAASVLT